MPLTQPLPSTTNYHCPQCGQAVRLSGSPWAFRNQLPYMQSWVCDYCVIDGYFPLPLGD